METIVKNNKEEVLDLVLDGFSRGMTYTEYRDLVNGLAQNRATTGPEQLESLINYTELGDRRMNRWDKTLKISEDLKNEVLALDRELTFLVLTESWCGDAAPSLPVINKVAELNPKIELRIVLRDENPELMDEFLTKGARSIPKLIVLDKKRNEIVGQWGPRPSIATQMVEDFKKERGHLTSDFKQDLQVWYNKDKGQNIQEDLLNLLALK
nr:thioredoxin family protein [Allomuricauda sp.]